MSNVLNKVILLGALGRPGGSRSSSMLQDAARAEDVDDAALQRVVGEDAGVGQLVRASEFLDFRAELAEAGEN